MASFIYLSSDCPLPTGGIREKGIKNKQNVIHFTLISLDFSSFKDNFDAKNQCYFSFSKNFSEGKHQVASKNMYLPSTTCKRLSQDNKKALDELFDYVVNHFENTQASYVEILFCSDRSKDKPLRQEKLISSDRLSVDDLYYEELKFIRIDTQMTEFVFRRKIA